MAVKQIEILLKLNDKLTGKLDSTVSRVSGQLKKLQGQVENSTTSLIRDTKLGMEKIGFNTSGISSALSNLAVGVSVAGVGLIAAFVGLTKQAETGIRERNSNANILQGENKNLGFQQANDFVRKAQEDASKSAIKFGLTRAQLFDTIGATYDTNVSLGNVGKFGELNEKGKQNAASIGIVASNAGGDIQANANDISRLIEGSYSIEGLEELEVGKNNKKFLGELREIEKKNGKTLKEMSLQERERAVVLAQQKAIGKEQLEANQKTLSAQLQIWKDNLFHSQLGTFGLDRIVQVNGENTTAIGELGKLFEQVGVSLQGLGIPLIDPMQKLASGLRWLTDSLKSLPPLEFSVDGIWKIGQSLANGISGMAEQLSSWFAKDGIQIAATGIGVVGIALGGFLAQLGINFSNFLGTQLKGAWDLFATNTLAEFQNLYDFAKGLGGSIRSALSNLFSSITSAVQSIVNQIPGMSGSLNYLSQPQSNNSQNRSTLGAASAGNRYLGQNLHWLNAYDGLNLDAAIKKEMQHSPQGAKPVIANSSELIVPRNKLDKIKSGDFNLTLQIHTKVEKIEDSVKEAVGVYLKSVSMV